MKGIRRVDFHLDNWVKDGGRWRKKEGGEEDSRPEASRLRQETGFTKMPKVFEVRKRQSSGET
ncbi:MAG: hypothetical protein HQ559_05360 [Lentisphaerae bacterium]|nr:hypothetical protein [Lentisphaerota bacterium]